ncbi:peptidase M28-like protein [Mariniflexile fucanivorans]|uniref:Peptidase M28-like protein n=1 Tax=Mariniflexile fucanivorans TaxID=264023 RepID=A0A4R1RRF6_9FLAO|nr:M28 family peptidase [Mariniflexile fucanivorans]TCL68869.1 peptidase M28-like protein [Mariniflexile fucanivorans]
MKPLKIIYISFLCLFSTLCFSQSTVQDKADTKFLFDENLLLQHIKTLSSDAFEGRRTGMEGAIKAEKYIVNQFKLHNVLPLGKDFEQTFSFTSEGKKYNGTNVLGFIKGSLYPEKYIVISAHYDHEGIKKGKIYNGADDNASGISALFSFTEYFKSNPPKHSVILAAFDAEELGLKGSEYYVNNTIIPLKQIMVNLNMDMISRSDKNELFAVGTVYNKTLETVVSGHEYSKKIKFLKGHDEGNWKENWTEASDHASFHNKNIPFLYFGVDDHKDYHEPTDDYENIQPEFYIEAVKVIISVFEKIDVIQL